MSEKRAKEIARIELYYLKAWYKCLSRNGQF